MNIYIYLFILLIVTTNCSKWIHDDSECNLQIDDMDCSTPIAYDKDSQIAYLLRM